MVKVTSVLMQDSRAALVQDASLLSRLLACPHNVQEADAERQRSPFESGEDGESGDVSALRDSLQ